MKSRPSLIRHVIFFQVILLAFFFILALAALFYEYKVINDNIKGSSLVSQAEHIRQFLHVDGTGEARLVLPERVSSIYYNDHSLYRFAILSGQGKTLFSSQTNPLRPLYKIIDKTGSEYFRFDDLTRNLTFFGASFPYQVSGQEFIIQVAQDEGHHDVLADSLIEEFFEQIRWFVPLFFISLIACSIYVLRRGLLPLKTVSYHASQIGPSNVAERLPVDGVPQEIIPLVEAVNHVLDRLETGFKSQRRFTADAAHELRTPLAVLTARIDTLDPSETTKALKNDVGVMTRLTSQLLKAAQLEAVELSPKTKVDLLEVAREVAGLLTPLALKSGKMLEVLHDIEKIEIEGNEDVLFNMIRNLVENALCYTEKGTTVSISLDGKPSISVRDQGPGIPDDQKEHLFKRFWRAERNKGQGSGLGLSIVKEAVRIHNAKIEVSNHPEGGAVFTVTF